MNLENIIEYDGQWHKKGKDGNCEKFTMRDLKALIDQKEKEQKEMFKKIVEDSFKKATEEIHGGGNGRRLLIQTEGNIKNNI